MVAAVTLSPSSPPEHAIAHHPLPM